jgi:hypothetical protein
LAERQMLSAEIKVIHHHEATKMVDHSGDFAGIPRIGIFLTHQASAKIDGD